MGDLPVFLLSALRGGQPGMWLITAAGGASVDDLSAGHHRVHETAWILTGFQKERFDPVVNLSCCAIQSRFLFQEIAFDMLHNNGNVDVARGCLCSPGVLSVEHNEKRLVGLANRGGEPPY